MALLLLEVLSQLRRRKWKTIGSFGLHLTQHPKHGSLTEARALAYRLTRFGKCFAPSRWARPRHSTTSIRAMRCCLRMKDWTFSP
eukprot:7992090-Pyramimonas_sp.AAC.1